VLIILGIVQAEIRRQVNNVGSQGCELLDFMLGGPVRQGQEKQVTGWMASGSLNLSMVRLRRLGCTW
jgi:hypothetical protein